MRLLFAICLPLSLLASSKAFTVHQPAFSANQASLLSLRMGQEPNDAGLSRRAFGSTLGVMTLVSTVFGGSGPASAFMPSSMTLADEIKTLDFSLPSYDAISSSKASVETVEGLAEKYATQEEKPAPRAKAPKKESSPGSNPMANVLPSMKKSNTKAPKPKPAPLPREKKEKEEREPVIKTMDLSLPSYDAGTKEKSIFSL